MSDLSAFPVPEPILYARFVRKAAFDFPSERLDCAVLFLITEGKIRFSVADDPPEEADAGDAVFCPPGQPLRREMLEAVTLHIVRYAFSGDPDEFPRGKQTITDPRRVQTDLDRVETRFPIIRRLTPAQRHYLTDIWFELAGERSGGETSRTVSRDRLIESALERMDAHLGEHMTVNELAESCDLTPVSFIRRFTAVCGETPNRYLTGKRLAHAAKLLCDTTLPVSQIAHLCGYENEFYFTSVFHKALGETPTAYRTAHRV